MEELGEGQYHAKAETNNYIRTFGEVAQVRKAINENYQQTENIGGPRRGLSLRKRRNILMASLPNDRNYLLVELKTTGFENVTEIYT